MSKQYTEKMMTSQGSVPNKQKIRLALCITELYIGGAERALCELATRLDQTQFEPMVYSLLSKPEDPTNSCVPMLEKARIPVQFLDMKNFTSFFSTTRKLKNLLREQQAEVFLSYLFHANFLGRFAAKGAGIQHILAGIRVAEKEKAWHLKLDRWSSRFVEHYICVSQSVANFTQQQGKLSKNKISVIPNGIEPIIAPDFEKRKNQIIFVGRLTHQKGVDWLLETAQHWLPQLPDWELLLVGDGDQRSQLTAQLEQLALNACRERIHLIGWQADVMERLNNAKIMILPSRWEGMPNVVLQAMNSAMPVIVTQVEGVEEILGPLAKEQTCPFGETQTLCQKILNLAKDPEKMLLLGKENQRRVQEHFSIQAMVKQYETLILQLIQSAKQRE